MTRLAAVAAFVAALATPAGAASWAVRDLGAAEREADCVEAARRALEHYALAFGGTALDVREWTVSLADLDRRGLDAIVLCAAGGGGRTRGALVVHADRDDVARAIAAERIAALWREQVRALERARLDDLGFRPFRW
jgi:hypothetical protein